MSDETTTEQLAEPEPQATEFTPPEGWRLLEVGETLQEGDVSVRADGHWCPTERVGSTVGTKQRYIRPIDPQPQPQQEPQPEPQPEPVQVCEGRWQTRGGGVKDVTAMPTDHDEFAPAFPWWDGVDTWKNNGRWLATNESTMDLLEYLGPIEAQPEPEPQPADTADELRSEVSYVQNLLGESRQRVTQLEELVTSLRTINAAQEQAVERANRETEKLALQWAAVKEELKIAAAVSQQLQIELDAAQQVPADSPELRQLQLRLADMTLDRDQCKDAYDRIFADLVTIRETTKAEAVEAIVEWLQPVRRVDSPSLANETMQHLPQIMRHLTGLAQD